MARIWTRNTEALADTLRPATSRADGNIQAPLYSGIRQISHAPVSSPPWQSLISPRTMRQSEDMANMDGNMARMQ